MAKLQTIDELQAMALDHAEFMLLGEVDTQLAATWWVQFDNRPGEMLITPWEDEAEKLAVVEMIHNKLKDPHARNYAFLSEVWVATENLKRPTRLTPEQRSDRREAVLIHAFDRRGRGGVRVYDIKRDDKGAVTALPENKSPGGRWQGRMFNLFQDEKTQHSVVRRGVVTGNATITRTPVNACLDCGRKINAGAPTPDAPDASTPNPGDLAICLHCAHVMVYAQNLTVRAPTDAELVEIAGNPNMVRAVNMIVAFNKREHTR
jgi:hypothetical protein